MGNLVVIIMLNLLIALDNMDILILSFPVHEYWVSFHLFVFLKQFLSGMYCGF